MSTPCGPAALLDAAYIECLKRSRLLDGIPDERLDEVLAKLAPSPRPYADRDEVCREGAAANCLWIVVRGRIDVQHNANNLVDRATPYIVGEQAIIEPGTTRSATLIAYGMTEVLEIGRTGIENQDPDIAAILWRNLAAIVSRKLRDATVWRSLAIDRDRYNTALLRRFLNDHQHGLIRAQGAEISPDHLPTKLVRGRFVLVFTDVVGFSRLALEQQPEQTADLIRSCMQAQAEAFEGAGGCVDKFMGDGLMAYFVIPEAAGDADVSTICAAAFKAALEANERVKTRPIEGDPLGLRIGLHIGEALAGNFGSTSRMQVTLIGREVNAAARLEQAKIGMLREGTEIGDVRVSVAFFERLPPELQELLPYPAVMKAKQGDIPLRSGPPQPVA